MESTAVTTCDMQAAGEPLRIVTSGYPAPRGSTLLDKLRFARTHLDAYRIFLMSEPRGHRDMYGAVPVEPDGPDPADLAVLFLHNSGYSTMCGHAVLALGRFAVDRRLVEPVRPETPLRIQCPCGVIRAFVSYDRGASGPVRFYGVPSFVFASDVEATVDGRKLRVDVVYGGAFYCLTPAAALGLDVRTSPYWDLVNAASALTETVRKKVELRHPDGPELAFLYGTILTGGDDHLTNFCVFADRQVDRSPTGSGVMARMALLHQRGLVAVDQPRVFSSVLGSTMTGRVVETTRYHGCPAVVVEVSGHAYYTGQHRFLREDGDPLAAGFLLDHRRTQRD